MYNIDKNIAIPKLRSMNGESKYPHASLGVGESFFCPTANKFDSAYSMARVHGKSTGKRFCCRMENGGFRLWRVS
jgi:hypothetical protein